MQVETCRIYEDGTTGGYRVLVDRLWPRGISKDEANLDDHWKSLAPSDELRQWFDHDPEKWGSFRKKYLSELKENKDEVKAQLEEVSGEPLVLLYGAKDEEHNQARVLKEYIEKLKLE
ncbi:DUF488 domain-containing protein [Microbulbifer sp. HZ11]|uniref:DUF488 domain-containing protein n=1 Tax=Microbulbifer sp. HZ11 TaxID=1453501 RepID=UPI0005B94642|nr:DUF488 family protein [Microbulbifer sp. HZ11]